MVTACSGTFEGIKQDFGNIGSAMSKTKDNMTQPAENASALIQGELCPPITVNPSMNTLIEYQDATKPSADTMISSFELESTQTTCDMDDTFIAMQIDLNFEGTMGPKAKRNNGDQPFFSYPYFIAVTDMDGNELAREYFAANVTYEKNETEVALVETIRQRLPLINGTVPYNVEVGFQLTDEQMAMNQPSTKE